MVEDSGVDHSFQFLALWGSVVLHSFGFLGLEWCSTIDFSFFEICRVKKLLALEWELLVFVGPLTGPWKGLSISL